MTLIDLLANLPERFGRREQFFVRPALASSDNLAAIKLSSTVYYS